MTDIDAGRLQQENAYLKARVAQLQGDVTDLQAEIDRLRERLEHDTARRAAARAPNPLAGGQ